MMDNSASNEQRLRELNVKRISIKGQITKFRNYLSSFVIKPELLNIQMAELKLKLAKFEALSVRYDDLQNEIEVLNSENIQLEIDERDNVERDIVANIVAAKTKIESHSVKQESNCSSNNSSCHHDLQDVGLKLPQIQISKFDGAYFRWLEFRDTYENLIHNSNRITPIHKFHYLISYLEGDAARIVSNLEVSSANYAEAWKLLCSRYDNKRVLINHHLNSLFNVKPLPRESERSLRFLVDHVTKNLRALDSLGQPTDKWDVLIIFMLSSKLDSVTLIKWEEHCNSLEGDVPTLEQFKRFLIDRADVLESLNRNNNKQENNTIKNLPSNTSRNNYVLPSNQRQGHTPFTRSFASTNKTFYKPNATYMCIICNDNHKIYDCLVFKSKGIEERLADVAKYKLCMNCLRQGHFASDCRMGPCRDCKKKHNSLLHNHLEVSNNNASLDAENESIVNFCNQNPGQILLSTALIEVSNPVISQKVQVRALLDCGSQSSFISKTLKDKLALKSNPIDTLKVIGIGNNCSIKAVESCNPQINSLNSQFKIALSCFVLNELTGYLPKSKVNLHDLNLPKDIQLADPNFHQPAPIDVLIGADIFWDILGNEQRSLGENKPKLRSSKFGWIVSGPTNINNSNQKIHCNHALISKSTQNEIDNNLTKFWDLEEVPSKPILSENDKACEKHFLTHTTRDESGRFNVKLPLIDTPDCLGDTYKLANKRFMNLEKRFKRNPTLKSEYAKFINEYGDLNHLSLSTINKPETSYFLCHHAVLKEDSESTKLRVVFDGSAQSSSGYSLNDILMVGPNVQDSLFSILIRARQYKYLLTGDIEKMYRQVSVCEEDRDLQLILWREDESQPIRTLKLNTLTYGTASASYLSTRCLWQLGEEHTDGLIKNIIQKDFYVDDLITGANDEHQLRYIQNSISKALQAGCFNLRKYKSNLPNLFKNIQTEQTQDKLTISESSSTLGLGWSPSTDTFHFPIKTFSTDKNNINKRFIMSNSFKIFDPLGLLSPVVIQPKIILQRLWQQKIDWDEPVSQAIKEDWEKFSNNLICLNNLHVSRIVVCDAPKLIEMHSFSDASQCAYGACIYMRTVNYNDDVTVRLLCAKSKVSPIKPTTMPRLELCAALLAARLSKSVLDSLRYRPGRIVHWCDSSIVLAWINNDLKLNKLKSFVANRISEILENTEQSSWRYVPTASNPADLISRGVDACNLVPMDLWWYGPDFLQQNEVAWPVLKQNKCDNLPEIKSNPAIITEPLINFERYSSLNKLQRLFAYVKRFLYNLRNPKTKRLGPLSVEDLTESFNSLCVMAQRQSFPVEYDLLSKDKPLNTKCKILSLSPFLDKSNLIRVGGRLEASNCSYERKHPILLHSTHQLTKLLFQREHINNMHAGPQLLLAAVRETVWPVSGRHLARRTVNNCTRCRRLRGKTLVPKMGNLPAQRVNPDFPFLSVGLDFAGPFHILNRKGRGSRLIKCYLCLFVCLRYKCIHLEAVSDLSKDAFVMTLRRFIARRGKPAEILCDNGRNFVAAAKDVGTFLKDSAEPLSDFASQQGIKFTFIPTYAPHFGGIWEAGVKSAKHHLRRVIGNSHLTFEEISTLFAQVEAILNSRPLCPLSSCPNDFLSLSPGHFLIGRPLTALPSPSFEDCNESRLQRYNRLQMIRHHFWQRWQREYLSELQQRFKWKANMDKLSVGDLVLLQEDNLPPLSWRLGRVLRLFPGPDGVSRVADVNTIKGCVRRPLVRLCPLPTTEELRG
ncbi:uncharacterized protein LOC126375229 [Pectinophora gossypiella]|nr:uncharacterized protein LOC126375229 [Pectinophora gossypiella]